MENMIPMLAGGLRKRPGTWFDGNTDKDVSTGKYKEARLIEWLLSDGSCFILEITTGTIRAWRDQGNNTYQVIQTIPSPYTAEQINKLHYASSANTMWIVHSQQKPVKLAWDGSAITLTEPTFTGKDFTAINERPSCVAFESGRLCFAGTNNEPNRIYLSRAPDSINGVDRYTDFTTQEVYTTTRETHRIAKDEDGNKIYEDDVAFKINATSLEQHTLIYKGKTFYMVLNYASSIPEVEDGHAARYRYVYNAYRTNAALYIGQLEYLYDYRVDDMIVNYSRGALPADDPDLAVLGASSPYYRVAPPYEPNNSSNLGHWWEYKTWYTKQNPRTEPTPKYETITEEIENITVTASHAIVLEENDMHGSRLQWIAGNRHLLAATERATWSDTGEVPTPATFDMNIIEYAGSSDLQARGTKEIMIYAGRDGKSLRALVWNQNSQGSGYIDMDISEQAAHLLGAGIKDFAVSDYPYPMIWIVTKAGELVSCTINIRSGIIAYSKHPTDGIVEAVAVAPQRTGDVIFLSVNRDEKRNIEHLIIEDLVNSDFTDSHYIDAGEKRVFNAPTKTITGLERFAGKTIHAFVDGAMEPPVTVSNNGTAEFQIAVSKIHFGLPYKAAFIPNTRQIPANGTSVGKKRRIEKITLQLYKSIGGKAGTDENKITAIITKRFGEYELGTAPAPFTGEYDITVSGNIDTEGKLVITHEEPYPFTILALVERVAILEA
jgi:hypothetical protein